MLTVLLLFLTISGIATFLAGTFKNSDTQWGGQISGGITIAVLSIAGILAAVAWNDTAGVSTENIYGVLKSGPLTSVGSIILCIIGGLVAAGVMTNPSKYKTGVAELYAFIIFSVLGGILVVSAQNLLVLYLGIELSSYSTYIMVGYYRDDRYSNEAASKYFMLGALASAFLLFGMSFIYAGSAIASDARAGSLDYAGIAQNLQTGNISPFIFLGVALLLVGFGFKLALVPFHSWTPDAYQGAPSMVAALLSVGPKAAVAIGLVTLLNTAFGQAEIANAWRQAIMWLAIISMTVGNLQALQQNNLKRMLGYSSIAQLGYVMIGVVAASSAGTSALIFYVLGYAITNIGAFASIAAMRDAGIGEEIEDYAGLAQRNPLAATIMAGFFMSLAGVPLFAGFLAKVFIFKSAVDAGFSTLVIVAVLNTVVAYFYYFRVIVQMFLAVPRSSSAIHVNWTAISVLATALVAVIALGTFPGGAYSLIESAAKVLPALAIR